MSQNQEVFRAAFPNVSSPYGLPFYESCAKHVKETFHSERPYVIASTTLSKKTEFLSQLQKALGGSLAGTWIGIKPHTPQDQLLEIVDDVRKKNADCIITLGGGSLSDGAKVISYALANNVTSEAKLSGLAMKVDANDPHKSGASLGNALVIPIICIPISLSGAEYSCFGAATDTRNNLKRMWTHNHMYPSLVILDPVLTLGTPDSIWLSTGVRSIDHCVEGYLSTNGNVESAEAAKEGLKLLVRGLIATKKNPQDKDARLSSQLGSNLSMQILFLKVWKGASHGIGHQLGPFGVGHGETSCILSPAVQKYNAKVNGTQQAVLSDILWSQEPAEEVMLAAGLTRENSDLGDAMRAIFNALGMPSSLKQFGVGPDKFDQLAQNSLEDLYTHTNPVPLHTKEQVKEILMMVAE